MATLLGIDQPVVDVTRSSTHLADVCSSIADRRVRLHLHCASDACLDRREAWMERDICQIDDSDQQSLAGFAPRDC